MLKTIIGLNRSHQSIAVQTSQSGGWASFRVLQETSAVTYVYPQNFETFSEAEAFAKTRLRRVGVVFSSGSRSAAKTFKGVDIS